MPVNIQGALNTLTTIATAGSQIIDIGKNAVEQVKQSSGQVASKPISQTAVITSSGSGTTGNGSVLLLLGSVIALLAFKRF